MISWPSGAALHTHHLVLLPALSCHFEVDDVTDGGDAPGLVWDAASLRQGGKHGSRSEQLQLKQPPPCLIPCLPSCLFLVMLCCKEETSYPLCLHVWFTELSQDHREKHLLVDTKCWCQWLIRKNLSACNCISIPWKVQFFWWWVLPGSPTAHICQPMLLWWEGSESAGIVHPREVTEIGHSFLLLLRSCRMNSKLSQAGIMPLWSLLHFSCAFPGLSSQLH